MTVILSKYSTYDYMFKRIINIVSHSDIHLSKVHSRRMSQFSSKVLLSEISRARCIENIKKLPAFQHQNVKINQTAAVLLPLCEINGEVSLLYTLRSSNLKSHKGQVSFPGGMSDPGESVIETALRETTEELGISPDQIDVWCEMPAVQGRNVELLIYPVVGFIKNYESQILKPSENEVAEVFTVPLRNLCDKSIHGYLNYKKMFLPVYIYGKYKIWGITAFITHFFLQCLLPNDVYCIEITKKYEMDELMPSNL